MKKTIFLITLLSLACLTGCTKQINKEDIPERYRNPSYCEINKDCKYDIFDGCCGTVVNKYNKNIKLYNGEDCNMLCPPKGIDDFFCDNNYCRKKINCDKACTKINKNEFKIESSSYNYIMNKCYCK